MNHSKKLAASIRVYESTGDLGLAAEALGKSARGFRRYLLFHPGVARAMNAALRKRKIELVEKIDDIMEYAMTGGRHGGMKPRRSKP